MLVFIAIAVGAFILVAGSFLFGHDHEVDHTPTMTTGTGA